MRLSFIGLGAMGYPIAGHLGRKCPPTAVWNRTSGVAASHASEFGTIALADRSASAAPVVFSCLPTSREVAESIAEIAPRLASGSIWVDLTSGDPRAAREAAATLAARGVAYLDAPVSGGLNGARAGNLTVMVGGDARALDEIRPLLLSFATKVVHMGASGTGFAMKAVNNTMLAIHLVSAAEGVRALEREGIDATTALEVLNASSGRTHVTEKLLPAPVANGEFPLTFKLALLAKDAGIGARLMAGESPTPTLTAVTVEALARAVAARGGQVDYLELFASERGDGT